MSAREKTHLGMLIEQQKRLNDMSDAQLVARAVARGERLGKSNLGRVAAGENPSLSRNTIFGLAAGLGVTPATVARAVLADMGIVFTEPEADSEMAIRSDPTLPEQGRRLMLTLLTEIRAGSGSDQSIYQPTGRLNPAEISGTRASGDHLAALEAEHSDWA